MCRPYTYLGSSLLHIANTGYKSVRDLPQILSSSRMSSGTAATAAASVLYVLFCFRNLRDIEIAIFSNSKNGEDLDRMSL